jgi:hypothetical protein
VGDYVIPRNSRVCVRFGDLYGSLPQRWEFQEYLAELLAPRHRSRKLTTLAMAEPVTRAQRPAMQPPISHIRISYPVHHSR